MSVAVINILVFGLVVPGFLAWRSARLIKADSQWIVLSRWYKVYSLQLRYLKLIRHEEFHAGTNQKQTFGKSLLLVVSF